MLWKEVKSWCKENGYKTDRSKIKKEEDEESNSYLYTWIKIDDPEINGTATSVSKLATIIYNRLTNNKWVEYQKEYKEKLAKTDIDHGQEFGFK